jgi:eukaryotic-like serine/threonine-protein kinase
VLKPGAFVRSENKQLKYKLHESLGSGGQGEVFRATLDSHAVAVKWYYPGAATGEQRATLELLLSRGAPGPQFLWPLDLVSSDQMPGFGYVMPIRTAKFRHISELMTRKVEPTFRAILTASSGLSEGYLQLHSRGLCYRDISFGNVFLAPDDGEILICDNDNIAVNGTVNSTVFGTPGFMAPEIMRGEALPSIQTDLFSLAVLLFYLLMMHHPLEGTREAQIRCLDEPARRKLYGTEPVFIFDPVDKSNAPLRGYHDNAIAFWPIYPDYLRELFIRSFTCGIRRPSARVRESEWRATLVRARDAIVYCGNCGAENFAQEDSPENGLPRMTCWGCSGAFEGPPWLRVGRDISVALNHDTQLFPHHVDGSRRYDFSAPLAAVSKHPTVANAWGLKNLSPEVWVCTTPQGMSMEVPPGRTVRLASGTEIHFGKARAVVFAGGSAH